MATVGNCGNDASIQGLPDRELTIGWWGLLDSYGGGGEGRWFDKRGTGTGWYAYSTASGLVVLSDCVTTDAESRMSDILGADGSWHYFTLYYNNSGDRRWYGALDGEWSASYATQIAGVGALASDAGNDLLFGNNPGGNRTLDGGLGWVAFWEGDHHGVGVDFVVPTVAPVEDTDLIECWTFEEQAGSVAAATVNYQNACNLVDHSWLDYSWDVSWESPDMDASEEFVSAEIVRGFNSPLARMAAMGRATIILNNVYRQFSPALHSHVRPGRGIRLDMTYPIVGGTTVTLFEGKIDGIAPTSGVYEQRQVTLSCVDEMERIGGVEAKIPLLQNVFADEIVTAVTDALGILVHDYEAGLNVFATSADRWTHDPTGAVAALESTYYERGDAAGKILDAVTADWGVFFIARDNVPTFYNRHHAPLDVTTVLALTTPLEIGYRMSKGWIYNIIEVKCHPRQTGDAVEVLWEMDTEAAPRIDAGTTLTMDCKFRDPVNEAITLGGVDCLALVAGTDYTATSDEPGEGDDKTGSVTIGATFYGDRAVLDITNGDSDSVYLQTCQVRGRAIRVHSPWVAIREDAASQTRYGARRLRINAILMSAPHQSERLAEYLLDVYKDPWHEITGVQFVANESAALMIAARDLELVDRVTLTETQTGLTAHAGTVYKMTHKINGPPAAGHVVVLDVATAYDPGGNPFRLETDPPGGGSALNSGDVLWY